MRIFLTYLVLIVSFSSYADEVVLRSCESSIESEVFRSTDSFKSIVIYSGVICWSERPCQYIQQQQPAPEHVTILDRVVHMLRGERKVYKGKLYTCD